MVLAIEKRPQPCHANTHFVHFALFVLPMVVISLIDLFDFSCISCSSGLLCIVVAWLC